MRDSNYTTFNTSQHSYGENSITPTGSKIFWVGLSMILMKLPENLQGQIYAVYQKTGTLFTFAITLCVGDRSLKYLAIL